MHEFDIQQYLKLFCFPFFVKSVFFCQVNWVAQIILLYNKSPEEKRDPRLVYLPFQRQRDKFRKVGYENTKKGSNAYFTEDKSCSKKTQSNELVATSPLILRSDFPTKSKGQSNTKGFPKTNKAPIASFPASDIASLC